MRRGVSRTIGISTLHLLHWYDSLLLGVFRRRPWRPQWLTASRGGVEKIADALDTTVDFLINGDTEDKANTVLKDAEVIRYFKEVDNLPQEDELALLRVIGGFLRDVKTKQAAF